MQAEIAVGEANISEEVVAKAEGEGTKTEPQQPISPTVAELEAKIVALEAKYTREVGDKDRGNARLSGEIKKLKEGLVALARRQFGEEDLPAETSELQRWLDQHLPADNPTAPKMNQVQAAAVVAIQTLAEEYGIDLAKIPPELNATVEEATNLYASETPQKAVDVWRMGLRKFKADNEAKTHPPIKAEVKMPVDRTPSQGGSGSRKSITAQEIKNMPIEEYFQRHQEIQQAEQEGRIK